MPSFIQYLQSLSVLSAVVLAALSSIFVQWWLKPGFAHEVPTDCLDFHISRPALEYVSLCSRKPYAVPKPLESLLDVIKKNPQLSKLSALIAEPAGFEAAFDTHATWNFTFFAPSNEAFEHTGKYFDSTISTKKGKPWLGNILLHHYVPFSVVKKSVFTSESSRLQTSSFLYISAQKTGSVVTLNNVARIVEADIPVHNGVVHIIDRVLDPSAQIFEKDLQNIPQTYLAGSCADNTRLEC